MADEDRRQVFIIDQGVQILVEAAKDDLQVTDSFLSALSN